MNYCNKDILTDLISEFEKITIENPLHLREREKKIIKGLDVIILNESGCESINKYLFVVMSQNEPLYMFYMLYFINKNKLHLESCLGMGVTVQEKARRLGLDWDRMGYRFPILSDNVVKKII